MIYDILERKLERSFLLVPGESLFRNYMPPEITIGAMVKVPLQGISTDPHIENYYRGQMQVITRHTDPVAGDLLANQIGRALLVRAAEQHPPSMERGEAEIKFFFPATLPIRFPRLEGNGYEWSQTFSTHFAFEPLD